MRVSGLDRLSWRPRDPSASLRFYRDVLGLRAETTAEGMLLALGGGPRLLLLTHAAAPSSPLSLRLDLQVEDPDGLRDLLTSRGLRSSGEVRDDGRGWRYFDAVDPDGLTLRFQRPAPARP